MCNRRRAHGDHVYVVARQQVAVVGIGVGDVVVAGEFGGATIDRVGHGHDVNVGLGREARLVGTAGNAAGRR